MSASTLTAEEATIDTVNPISVTSILEQGQRNKYSVTETVCLEGGMGDERAFRTVITLDNYAEQAGATVEVFTANGWTEVIRVYGQDVLDATYNPYGPLRTNDRVTKLSGYGHELLWRAIQVVETTL